MSQPAVRAFGAGRFFGINNTANSTPARFITPQDMSLDIKRSTKSLFGEKQLAEEVAAGEMSVTGKVTMGGFSARIVTDLLFGDTGATGQILQVDGEAGTVPAVSTYIVTVVNSTHWTTNLGVLNATTGAVMTRVASGPASGQYSVAAGVYTFAAADANANVLISYLYTNSATGETVVLGNQLQGPTGGFTAVMNYLYGSLSQQVLTLTNCIASDAAFASKGSDFVKPTFGFECATDSTGSLGSMSFAQAA